MSHLRWASSGIFRASHSTPERSIGLKININDSEEFGRLLKRLASDIVNGSIHYKLYKDLVESARDYEVELNTYRGFWSLTIGAHYTTALLRLLRVYDQERKSLSLKNWLDTIQDNRNLFGAGEGAGLPEVIQRGAKPPDPSVLKEDLELVGANNDLVKKLVKLRNNIYAHTNALNIACEIEFEKKIPLTFGDLDKLFHRGETILNRYSSLFQRSSWSSDMVGRDDYLYVLKALRRDRERHEAEIEAEMKDLEETR